MKKIIAKTTLCALAAGLLISGTAVYGAHADQTAEIPAYSTTWRKKDKNKVDNPEETPAESPAPTEAPKPDSKETSGGSFVRYHFNETADIYHYTAPTTGFPTETDDNYIDQNNSGEDELLEEQSNTVPIYR
ncbi:MAG: hypothetical protein FWC93_02095 [Defluviitaleaceae bacterium]|nr:hypothetical protein [Defluviitaleaceae bacterium]